MMYFVRALFILVLLDVGVPLLAQVTSSKAQLWRAITSAYENEDSMQQVVVLTERLLTECAPLDSTDLIRAIKYRGRAQRVLGHYVDAIDNFKQVHRYATSQADSLLMAEAADQIGIMNTFMGNMQEGQQYLIEAAELYQAVGTLENQADANNGLAIFYHDVGQTAKAVATYQLALRQYEALDDTMGRANVHANLGLLYLYENEFALAEENILMQGYLDTLLQTDWGLGFHYSFMGSLRSRQERYTEALYWHQTALRLRQNLPSAYNLADARSGLADVLLQVGRYQDAIEQARLILAERAKHESLSLQTSAYAHLSDAYKGLGQLDSALAYYEDYKTMSDSIYQRDMLAEVANKDALYRKALQDEEIARLDADNTVKTAKLRNQRIVLIISTLAILVFVVLMTMLLRLYRRVSQQKVQLEQALQDKELLLKEIHHRVKNNLQMVSSMLNLQSRHLSDLAAKDALQLGKSRVRSMAMIHQQLYMGQDVNTLVATRDYLEKLTEELVHTYCPEHLSLELDLSVAEVELDIDALIPIGLIVNEAVTNAIKYAFTERQHGSIRVSLQAIAPDQYQLTIADNGIGYQPTVDEQNYRFGTLLMETLAQQLDGKLERTSSEAGTKIGMRFVTL